MTKLTFLGTGTSQGIPVIACGCWVCSSGDSRDKRLRSSVLVEQNGVSILIDVGPDFRTQMLSRDVRHIDGVLLTHAHRDHIAGLDDLRAFNHSTAAPVDIYAAPAVLDAVKKDFAYAFCEDKYPGSPDLELHPISDKPFDVKGIKVVPIEGEHYRMPVTGFRIGGIAYLTDFKHIDEKEIEKIKGVDILVVNALRKESHISHFTLDQALHLSWQVGARETYFTHISHQMGRHSQEDPKLPPGNKFAYDGLVVESL